MQWTNLLIAAAWLLASAASADSDTPRDPVAVAKTCSMCHLGNNRLDKLEPQELIDGITRIHDGELPHPSIPKDVDPNALAAAIGEPGPTSP